MSIRFANAPCSWGTIEGWGQGVPYQHMLDELVATGYNATELGDYGYMPTDPQALRDALEQRGLTMLGAYEGVDLRDANAHSEGEGRVLRVAHLLKSVADLGDPNWQPLVVLADEHSKDPTRFYNAGQVTPAMALDDAGWKTFAHGANRIAKAVHDETGLRTVFHPHCAGWVETNSEIARFLDETDARTIGLVFDTGHCLYGSGANDGAVVPAALERFASRVWYMHFKDCHAEIAARARKEHWDYKRAITAGVFCELGQGEVPFADVLHTLKRIGYDGWITVEQDVLAGMGEPRASAQRNRDYLRQISGI